MKAFKYENASVRLGDNVIFLRSGNCQAMIAKPPNFDYDYSIAMKSETPEASCFKVVMDAFGVEQKATPQSLVIDNSAFDG